MKRNDRRRAKSNGRRRAVYPRSFQYSSLTGRQKATYARTTNLITDLRRREDRSQMERERTPWIYKAWHFILSRELGFPHKPPAWLKQPAVKAVPITTPQILARLGVFKDDLRPFTVMTVPFPKRETANPEASAVSTNSCRKCGTSHR